MNSWSLEVLLGSSQTSVTSLNSALLRESLERGGFEVHGPEGNRDTGSSSSTDVPLLTSATAKEVGQIALAHSIVLTGLAPAKGGGLEDLFFNLTENHAREEVSK